MARKKTNKSQAIRDYLNTNLKAGPTTVVQELKKKGVAVTVPLVSNVKSRMLAKNGKMSKRGRKRKVVVARKTRGRRPASEMVAVSRLLEARSFAEKVGGVDKAIVLLQTLEKIKG